ncbi:MAG: TRAP transporter substrate-binding protein [Pseudomonadales bacterium]|nr:TRAP transporter substrate-binding protein [Pseudomonadales bacterium]NRA17409.1 TRAP transporter substrate-binding protein [Oceanospirillaceae bacterium]
MKKFNFVKSIAISVLFGVATTAMAKDPIVIQVNNTMKPGGSEEAAITAFSEYLQKHAPGDFKTIPFLSGQLGGENAVLELLNIGQTQISLTASNWRTQYAPEYDPISIPFLFPSNESIAAYMETDSGKRLEEIAKNKGGIIHLGVQNRAARHMTANKRIDSPDDLSGFKLRLPGVPVWVDVWEAIGAQPVIVPAPEIYLAMSTGQVDGHENSLASPYNRKLEEVQSHLIMTSHVYSPWHWVASRDWWNTLSSEDQNIIKDAVNVAKKVGSETEATKDKFYLIELQKKGMQVVYPDRSLFKAKAQHAIAKAMQNLAPGVAEDIKKVIQ